jgi:hypothetical protein
LIVNNQKARSPQLEGHQLRNERRLAFRHLDFAGRVRRQLQYRRSLTFAQMCQQDDFSVRELKGVMMTVRLTPVDLLELGHPVPETARKDEPSFASYLVLEGKFGARKQTNSYAWVIYGSKTARDGVVKSRRYQGLAYLRRPGRDEF